MWIFTTVGFFSVVQVRGNPDLLLVRARALEDLRRLQLLAPGIKILKTPKADYAYRVTMSREGFKEVMLKMVSDLDYFNFKSAVKERHSKSREKAYESVWYSLLCDLQLNRKFSI